MKKIKLSYQPGMPASMESALPALPIRDSVAAAAQRLIDCLELEAGRPDDGRSVDTRSKGLDGAPESIDALGISALQERCLSFGVDATSAELLLAGLYLLAQQTETALEVAVLQSLRADRTFAKRRSKRF